MRALGFSGESTVKDGTWFASAARMRVTILPIVSWMLVLSCKGEERPPRTLRRPPAPRRKPTPRCSRRAPKRCRTLPIRGFDHYLDGFHVMKDEPSHHMEAHHYCKGMNEEFTQCVIFDGNTKDANMIGLEYIISEEPVRDAGGRREEELAPAQLRNSLGAAGAARRARRRRKGCAQEEDEQLRQDVARLGHRPCRSPCVAQAAGRYAAARVVVQPTTAKLRLVWSKTRDKRMKIDTAEKRKERAELSAVAKPQMGVDDLKGKIVMPAGHVGHDGGPHSGK